MIRQVRGGAALTGLRRQLWSRRVSVHLVTPLARYPLLATPLHGLRPGGEAVTANSSLRLTLPPHQVSQTSRVGGGGTTNVFGKGVIAANYDRTLNFDGESCLSSLL